LKADNLHRHYPVSLGIGKGRAVVKALNGVSFELAARQNAGHVVGESGCGKSTLARQLTLIEAPSGRRIIYQPSRHRQAGQTALEKHLRTQIQMVFQNPYGSLNPRQTIAYQLAEPLSIHTRLRVKPKSRKSARP
jgi:dipeptide transport system ATP-binding protein